MEQINNKQSSVDILFEELFNSFEKFNNGKFCLSEYMAHNLKVLEQAKAKHKEEVTSFTADWSIQYKYENGKNINQYYKETFEE